MAGDPVGVEQQLNVIAREELGPLPKMSLPRETARTATGLQAAR